MKMWVALVFEFAFKMDQFSSSQVFTLNKVTQAFQEFSFIFKLGIKNFVV